MEWYQNLYGTGSGTVHKHKLIFFDEDVSCLALSLKSTGGRRKTVDCSKPLTLLF